MITIIKASGSEAEIISRLGRITFSETFGNLFSGAELEKYLSSTFSVEKISNSLLKKNNIYWVAYYDELPVGYAKVKLDSNTEGISNLNQIQLQKIYVLKEYLHKNIGTDLMNEIMKIEELKQSTAFWLVVLHTNEGAIRFYEKLGFRFLRKHFHQIGTHNYEYKIMIKEI